MLLLVEITSLLNPKNERVKKTATYFDSHRFFGIYYNIMFERSKLYSLNWCRFFKKVGGGGEESTLSMYIFRDLYCPCVTVIMTCQKPSFLSFGAHVKVRQNTSSNTIIWVILKEQT